MKKSITYLSFKIGSETFAANTSFVHNIIELPKITNMPEMPDYMLGVINLRGNVLPVIDSRIKIGIKNTAITSNTCIVVMEINYKDSPVLIGFLVDSVSEVLEINDEKIIEPPKIGTQIESYFISGIFESSNDKFVMILDMKNVLSSDVSKLNLDKQLVESK